MQHEEHARRALALAFGAEDTAPARVLLKSPRRPGARAHPAPTVWVESPAIVRRMLLPPSELSFAESFVHGAVEVEGDLEEVLALPRRLQRGPVHVSEVVRLLWHLLALPRHGDDRAAGVRLDGGVASGRRHGLARDSRVVRAHYDLGNAFYALWLDRALVYSCAYFPPGIDDLELAQQAKLELLCRKLRLQKGHRLLDIGCGWGALIRHAARHYGVEAVGVTLSREQAQAATERIARDGLSDRCRVVTADYRELTGMHGLPAHFDRIASIGMIEHVGRRHLGDYFRRVRALLRPGGVFLSHGIVAGADYYPRRLHTRVLHRAWRTGAFIDRYIFPDGELPKPQEVIAAACDAGFEVHDVESLRMHYVRTLRHWRQRLEAAAAPAVAMIGAERYRAWRLYLAASADAFVRGYIGLHQVVLGALDADGASDLPDTRDDLLATSLLTPAGGT